MNVFRAFEEIFPFAQLWLKVQKKLQNLLELTADDTTSYNCLDLINLSFLFLTVVFDFCFPKSKNDEF